MNVLLLTHTYPTRDKPWVTPFMGHYARALADQPDVQLHVLVPEVAGLEGAGIHFHTFPVRGRRIAHKGIGRSIEGISAREQAGFLWNGVRAGRRICVENKIDLIHAHW